MNLQGPSNAVIGPAPTPNVQVLSVSFDLQAHTFVVTYQLAGGGGPGNTKSIQGPIPGAVQTAIENHAKAVIETDQGWAPGSSTVTAP